MVPDGLVMLSSSFGPKETMDRLVAAVEARGMTVMARIDHAAGAKTVGLELKEMELLIFGNPRAGTSLMQAAPTMGIDLPLKALVYDDATGATGLAYNDPFWLASRHGLPTSSQNLAAMSAALAAIAKVGTSVTG